MSQVYNNLLRVTQMQDDIICGVKVKQFNQDVLKIWTYAINLSRKSKDNIPDVSYNTRIFSQRKRKHHQVVRTSLNSLFQTTLTRQKQQEMYECFKTSCSCMGKSWARGLTTVSTQLGSSLQFTTRINGFFGRSGAGQMHLDVHLSMSSCLEEFADGWVGIT